jgi:hypothetical protein
MSAVASRTSGRASRGWLVPASSCCGWGSVFFGFLVGEVAGARSPYDGVYTSRRSSLVRMRETWGLTVCSPTNSAAAISALEQLRASSSRTWRSRVVRRSARPAGGGRYCCGEAGDQAPGYRGVDEGLATGRDANGHEEVLTGHAREQETAGAWSAR